MTKESSNPARKKEPLSEERAALEGLVETVVGAAYEVSNVLGAGFLEKIYERALIEELGLRGLRVKAQTPFPVVYKGKPIGTYSADLLVEDRLLVEVKCVDGFSNEHLAQCINLSEGLWTPPCFADQLSSAQSGMAPRRPRSLIRVNSRMFAAYKFT